MSNKVQNELFDVLKHSIQCSDQFTDVLLFSIKMGYLEVMRLLLDSVGTINLDIPLRESVYYGHVEVVRLLLDRGADIHANNDNALRWSTCRGHLEVVRLLLDRGAEIHAGDEEP
jgi:ankyrin repeat protein